VPWIYLAGVIQLIIAGANFIIPKNLDYEGNLKNVSPIVRQVFSIHSVHIFWTLLAFASICLFYPNDLTSPNPLGKFLTGWMSLFWGARVVIPRLYYDRETKRLNRLGDVGFTLAFVYLAVVFAITFLAQT